MRSSELRIQRALPHFSGPVGSLAQVTGRTIVIGLGSPLMGDDGVGIRALEELRAGWTFRPEIDLVDGGTWGMQLLPLIEDADRVLFIDAIDWGAPEGSCVRLEREDLPKFLSQKLSPHQIDLKEVLAVAELRGTIPDETVALGVQPSQVTLSDSLSVRVGNSVNDLLKAVVAQLERWGYRGEPIESTDA